MRDPQTYSAYVELPTYSSPSFEMIGLLAAKSLKPRSCSGPSVRANKVGASLHLEYWIPAEKFAEFNQNIVGLIEVISEFHDR